MGALAVLLPTAAASARDRWSVRGAGWGHGVGMSQFGAYGFARQGYNYRQILAHYYRGTRVTRGSVSVVRVLLQANRPTISFTGATQAGNRNLVESSVYRATRDGSAVVLRSESGRPLRTYSEVIPISGGTTFRLLGAAGNGVQNGIYRGSLEIRTAAGPGLNAINTLGMESYLQGVVPAESPPIWPPAALQAQAVAARSYASASNVGGKGFDQYPDTRSQVYRGFAAETPSTNNAVSATSGEVVTYNGQLVITYFFSSSGGYTENVENVFGGSEPKPWLKGVEDPYDDVSPYHRWGPYTWSTSAIDRKLGSYVRGRFRGFKILERGVSPRIVRALVRGSRGDRRVTGPQLRGRLNLRDTWFSIRRVSTKTSRAEARTSSGARSLTAIYGRVDPIRARFVQLQRLVNDSWVIVQDIPLAPRGRAASYRFHVGQRGVYRVLAGWAPGPDISIR